MSPTPPTIPPAEALSIYSLIAPTEHGIASRVLARTAGGSLTLTIGGTPVRATPGTIVRMPANVPHAVDAPEAARMLLVMLRDRKEE